MSQLDGRYSRKVSKVSSPFQFIRNWNICWKLKWKFLWWNYPSDYNDNKLMNYFIQNLKIIKSYFLNSIQCRKQIRETMRYFYVRIVWINNSSPIKKMNTLKHAACVLLFLLLIQSSLKGWSVCKVCLLEFLNTKCDLVTWTQLHLISHGKISYMYIIILINKILWEIILFILDKIIDIVDLIEKTGISSRGNAKVTMLLNIATFLK